MLLAYEMNGEPLPPQHGFPLRLVVPGWYGMTHVKWLERITVADRAVRRATSRSALPDRQRVRGRRRHAGHADAAALADGPARDPRLHDPRSGSSRRARTVRGPRLVGLGADRAVEVSTDGGRTLGRRDARRRRPRVGAGVAGRYEWDAASPASYELCCRATDAAGNVQPLEPEWNLQGIANNAVQRVPVAQSGAPDHVATAGCLPRRIVTVTRRAVAPGAAMRSVNRMPARSARPFRSRRTSSAPPVGDFIVLRVNGQPSPEQDSVTADPAASLASLSRDTLVQGARDPERREERSGSDRLRKSRIRPQAGAERVGAGAVLVRSRRPPCRLRRAGSPRWRRRSPAGA